MLAPKVPAEWAALRVWAAEVRDNRTLSPENRRLAESLCSLLDSQLRLKSDALWVSCKKLAERIVL